MLLVVLFAGCRAERLSFSFQPVNSGARENAVALVEAPSTRGAGVRLTGPPAAKPSVSIEPSRHHRAGKTGARTALVIKTHTPLFNRKQINRLQRKIQPAHHRKPTDGDNGLTAFFILVGIGCVGAFIVGLLSGSVVLAIILGLPLLLWLLTAFSDWFGSD
jgi:hypothetical protein